MFEFLVNLASYIDDNDNNMTFVGTYCLFALLVHSSSFIIEIHFLQTHQSVFAICTGLGEALLFSPSPCSTGSSPSQ